MYKLIMPLGILTYGLLIMTIASGLMISKFHVKWVKMRWHIWLGILTLAAATIHAALVIYLNM